MKEWVPVILGMLSTAGVSGGIGYCIKWRLGGKRTNEVQSTSEITDTAINLVNTIDEQMKTALARAEQAQAAADNAKQEADQARQQANRCQAELEDFKRQIIGISREEASWATQVRDALLKSRPDLWPKGLAHVPPIAALIPGWRE